MDIPDVLDKLADETRVYGFNFRKQKEITEGLQTLVGTPLMTSDPVTTPALVISTPVVDGTIVKASFSGGKIGTNYQITCDVATSGGAILGMLGNLLVIDPETMDVD